MEVGPDPSCNDEFSQVPPRAQTRLSHERRIEMAVDLIRQRPGRNFTLAELARSCGFSAYHFHRVFHAVTGETVAACIWRHRLEAAARHLRYTPGKRITEIALECGFSSSANFSRAFRVAFAMTPSAFRRADGAEGEIGKQGKALPPWQGYGGDMQTQVDIVTTADRLLACQRLRGDLTSPRITALFAGLEAWMEAQHCPLPAEAIGITWFDSQIAARELWRYDACFTVPPGTRESGATRIHTLYGGREARLRLRLEDPDRIEGAWAWLLRSWLPGTSEVLADRPSYEVYPTPSGTDGFDVILCLPLETA